MTTTTALLGALPLCFTPLGVSIVGGLIVSQALNPLYDADHLPLSRPAGTEA
jgi:hypothetical protein